MRLRVARRSTFFRFGLFCLMILIVQIYYHIDVKLLREKNKKVIHEIVHYAEKYRIIDASWIKQMKPLTKNVTEKKIVLFYTPYFRSMPWSQTTGNEMNLKAGAAGQPCKFSSCYISYSRQDFYRSDAVLFHFPSHLMPWEGEMKELFSRKRKGQKWVFFSEENPVSTGDYDIQTLNNMIDLTISYQQNSNIKSLYGYYIKNTDQSQAKRVATLLQKNGFSSGKDRLVLWFASNCVTPRLDIVKAISKFINVDVFGVCQKYFPNQKGQCGKYSQDCLNLAGRYKFYLAIENYQCRDYVTEKYWRNALSRNIVPIVVAGHYNKEILINGSYIDILDFPNAKALAQYLQYLDSNDTAYNMYFQWKKKFTAFEQTSPTWLCDLCELLHRNMSFTTWNMEQFWAVEQNCLADQNYIINTWLTSTANRLSVLFKGDQFWSFFSTFVLLFPQHLLSELLQ